MAEPRIKWTLAEAKERIIIECAECNRRGELSKASLLQRFDKDMGLVELLTAIAIEGGCHLAKAPTNTRRCKAVYAPESRLG